MVVEHFCSGPDSALGFRNREMNQSQIRTLEAHIPMGKAAAEIVTKQQKNIPTRPIPGPADPRQGSISLRLTGHRRTPAGGRENMLSPSTSTSRGSEAGK